MMSTTSFSMMMPNPKFGPQTARKKKRKKRKKRKKGPYG